MPCLRRLAVTCTALLLSVSSALAQGARVDAPLVVVKPDKQFDAGAAARAEGYLELAVRLLDFPTVGVDAARASAQLLSGDTTTHARLAANASGVVRFGLLPAGDYVVEGVRIGSPATSVVVRILPGCHIYVELYLTAQRFHIDAPTQPRATVTTCPDTSHDAGAAHRFGPARRNALCQPHARPGRPTVGHARCAE